MTGYRLKTERRKCKGYFQLGQMVIVQSIRTLNICQLNLPVRASSWYFSIASLHTTCHIYEPISWKELTCYKYTAQSVKMFKIHRDANLLTDSNIVKPFIFTSNYYGTRKKMHQSKTWWNMGIKISLN